MNAATPPQRPPADYGDPVVLRTDPAGARDVPLKHPRKLLFPGEGIARADLAAYYLEVAPVLLPYLHERPCSFTRWPDGIAGRSFFQKNPIAGLPPWVPTRPFGNVNHIRVEEPATLAYLVAAGVIEVHMALGTWPDPGHPDIAVIDLDPTPPAGWDAVQRTGRMVKRALDVLGVEGFPKTSGATGLHVFIALDRSLPAGGVRDAVRNLMRTLQRVAPAEVTLEYRVSRRRGVFLDYGQNARGRTMAAPYSVRPRPGAPVSTPITWDELAHVTPADFTVRTVPARLGRLGDPMAEIFRVRGIRATRLDPATTKKPDMPAQTSGGGRGI